MPDPPIQIGPYRVLPRTDGKLVVIDDRRAWDDRAVRVVHSLSEAKRVVEQLAAKGRA